jgi:tRNA (guanine37-N1)-methyltransferase
MKFHFLTLFPDIIQAYTCTSMMGRAVKNRHIEVETLDIRDFSTQKHRKVDDTPYGGGAGMVLQCQPTLAAWKKSEALLNAEGITPNKRKVIMLTPSGQPFTHALAKEWADAAQAFVFFCGHYEGFDARIPGLIPEMIEVSLGDFVLTGGELPALAMMDAVSRFIPGVVKDPQSVIADSFYNGLLDYPHYTRPPVFEGLAVPEVLLGGDHQRIESWRKEQALAKTLSSRPDLLSQFPETEIPDEVPVSKTAIPEKLKRKSMPTKTTTDNVTSVTIAALEQHRQYWLIKSEPYKFSWADLNRLGRDAWDGVRNFQARNYMQAMRVGDLCLFYHSNEGKEIVGVCEVVREAYPDPTFIPTAGKENPWVVVDVAPVTSLKKPVTLECIKRTATLEQMALLKQMRLSVSPVRPEEYQCIMELAG